MVEWLIILWLIIIAFKLDSVIDAVDEQNIPQTSTRRKYRNRKYNKAKQKYR